MKKVHALRGAVKVRNEESDIVKQLAALYDALLAENSIAESDIVSLIFSVTRDITAKNPAAALRASGRAGGVALFSTQEPDCSGAPPGGFVRVLMHCYMDEGRTPRHVYTNGAEILRPDWAGKRGS